MIETEKKRLGKIPSIRRLPLYLNKLIEYRDKGSDIITSSELAADMQLLPIVVKKDLQIVEPTTRRRAGYMVNGTIAAIRSFLGWHKPCNAALIGVGNLGSALLGYNGFSTLDFVAAFDIAPQKVGKKIHGVSVHDTKEFNAYAHKNQIEIVLLATPKEVAQSIVDSLDHSQIKGIWNFTPAKLTVPDTTSLQREDLSAGLAELCAKIKHNT